MLNIIKKVKKIFILAPANFASGGPELLHQLGFSLAKKGWDVSMYYPDNGNENPVHDNYVEYKLPFIRNVEDSEENLLIVPEANANFVKIYRSTKIVIWWLSVDNYFFKLSGIKGKFNQILQKFGSQDYLFFDNSLLTVIAHLTQSKYAEDFLIKKGVNQTYWLSDYLHDSFLRIKTDMLMKEDIIAYNPKKGLRFTKKLIQFAPNIKFVPIQNMSRNQVVELLQKAKVYIDFGFHPGRDRIPREAAILGCCLITNKKGSAAYYEDLPIPNEFKFDQTYENIPKIIETIRDCFLNFDDNYQKYETYVNEIFNQKSTFENDVDSIFGSKHS